MAATISFATKFNVIIIFQWDIFSWKLATKFGIFGSFDHRELQILFSTSRFLTMVH